MTQVFFQSLAGSVDDANVKAAGCCGELCEARHFLAPRRRQSLTWTCCILLSRHHPFHGTFVQLYPAETRELCQQLEQAGGDGFDGSIIAKSHVFLTC